jgi:hypothetical protein
MHLLDAQRRGIHVNRRIFMAIEALRIGIYSRDLNNTLTHDMQIIGKLCHGSATEVKTSKVRTRKVLLHTKLSEITQQSTQQAHKHLEN